jgi:hypothetical protein
MQGHGIAAYSHAPVMLRHRSALAPSVSRLCRLPPPPQAREDMPAASSGLHPPPLAGEVAAKRSEGAYPTLSPPQPAAIIAVKTNPSDSSAPGCIVRHMSFLHPPQGFPPHLSVIWPLIWVQVLLLRAAVRAAYGKGVQYHWSVTPNGRVFLTSIDWVPGQKKERSFPKPANDRLAAACDGRAFTPQYLRLQPLLLGEKGLGMRGNGISASAIRAATLRPLTPTPLPRERGLSRPLPET